MDHRKQTRHHIICSSRGGSNDPSNIARIGEKRHNLFHALFANKLPEEIIEYLVEYFWKGDWSYVELALAKKWQKESRSEKQTKRMLGLAN